MTDKLPKPKRPRLVHPAADKIPQGEQYAHLSVEDEKDGWHYYGKQGETGGEAFASVMLHPALNAAPTIRKFTGQTDLELHGLVNELQAQAEAANGGDLSRAEGMLVTQAHTLDAVFHVLARRAQANLGEYVETAEVYLRLAFKAQSQCRATLETLGQLKNPSQVAFVKQANIAHGPQQVNNTEPRARAGEIQSQPNKVLEDQRGKWMDPGAQEAAGRLNQAMAAMGTVHRPQVVRGQSEGQPERVQGRNSAVAA